MGMVVISGEKEIVALFLNLFLTITDDNPVAFRLDSLAHCIVGGSSDVVINVHFHNAGSDAIHIGEVDSLVLKVGEEDVLELYVIGVVMAVDGETEQRRAVVTQRGAV